MTDSQQRTFAILVDGLWSGQIGEVEFYQVGRDLGASADQLNTVLSDLHEEDGIWGC